MLKDRLSAFGERAKAALTGKPSGYNALNESLLNQSSGREDDFRPNAGLDDYHAAAAQVPSQQHGDYQPPGATQGNAAGVHIPSQAEMMMEVTYLAKEAAELLWETVAMQAGDPSPSPEMTVTTADLADKAQMLNSQLRGLIRNDEGKSEVLLAEALEANDMLDSCLSEYNAGKSGGANGTQAEASAGASNPAATPQTAGYEAPLIQLDDDMDALPPPAASASAAVPVSSGPTDMGALQANANPFASTTGVDPFAPLDNNKPLQ